MKKGSVKQCLTICAQDFKEVERARTDIFGNVSTAKDAQQIVLAMNGALVSVKRVTAGERSMQYLREMPNMTDIEAGIADEEFAWNG
jgi:hypothetical protein